MSVYPSHDTATATYFPTHSAQIKANHFPFKCNTFESMNTILWFVAWLFQPGDWRVMDADRRLKNFVTNIVFSFR